jgi:hypothetical protein
VVTCFAHPPLELVIKLDRKRNQHLRKQSRKERPEAISSSLARMPTSLAGSCRCHPKWWRRLSLEREGRMLKQESQIKKGPVGTGPFSSIGECWLGLSLILAGLAPEQAQA